MLGSVVATWVTFVPCFLWIFLGAPYAEWLHGRRALAGALSAITAAVVGVILNLAVWFSLHTLFAEVRELPRRDRRAEVMRCLEREVWPRVAPELLGRGISKAEQEEILGYGPEGV